MAKKKSQQKQNRARRMRNRGSGGLPDPTGDIPSRRRCTIETVSVPLPLTTQQVTLRQVEEHTNLVASNSANVATSYSFVLSNLENLSAISSIWDQYRIEAIRFSILPDNNAIGLVTNSATTLSQLYCVIDYDDDNTLASASAAKKYDNLAIVEPAESISRTFQPRMAVAAYSGVFTSFGNFAPQWIDMASTGVKHYGIKVFVPQVTVAQTLLQSWHITAEYWVSFRSVY